MRVRVIACGNPFMGNDAVGLEVMECILEAHPALDVVDGGLGGLGLIPLMEGYDRIIIVDATSGMGPLGSVQVFHDLHSSHLFPLSLHDMGIAESLQVARSLGMDSDVVVVGIEGGEITEYRKGMDPAVRDAVPIACHEVYRLIDGGS
jgi:hydrogenase maturation protease